MNRRYFFAFLPALMCAVVLAAGSLMSPDHIALLDNRFSLSDKVTHFLAYFVLASLMNWGYARLPGGWTRRYYFRVVVLASSFGILMEIGQWGMGQGRNFEVLDIFANISGALASYLITPYFKHA